MTVPDIIRYKMVQELSAIETKIKGSRFISCIDCCRCEEDVGAVLEKIRDMYPAATHYCYAATFGGMEGYERFSDNGEPSGTAGRPIMDILRSSGLKDTIIVVVRYFGGTLLGTGGLVKAYSGSAGSIVDTVKSVDMVLCVPYSLKLSYSEYECILKESSEALVVPPQAEYGVSVTADFHIYEKYSSRFEDIVCDVTKGTVHAYPKKKIFIRE